MTSRLTGKNMVVPPEFLEPTVLTYIAGVLIQLAAASWIFVLAPGDNRHRSLAALVTCNAIWDMVEGLFFASTGERSEYYLRVYIYLATWSAAALVWFLALYPVRRRRAALIGLTAAAAAAALSVWFAVDRTAADGAIFSLVSLAWTPLLVWGALTVVRAAHRDRQGPRAWSLTLVGAALLVYPLSQAVVVLSAQYWAYLWRNMTSWDSFGGVADAIVEVAYLVARVATLFLVAFTVWLASRQAVAARAKTLFVGTLLGVILVTRVLDTFGVDAPPINALIFGVITAYAVARAQLFDIDLRLKVTLSRGTVVAAFTFVFILVSETVEAFFEQLGGNYIVAAIAVGLLLFALTPLQNWANRLVHHMVPEVEKTPAYVADRKEELFRSALAEAWHDGTISAKERRMLDALAEKLGIEPGAAAGLESQLVRSLVTKPATA